MVHNYLQSNNAHQMEQSLQFGNMRIVQFDGNRMLNVQISQTLTGISLIVGSVGTLRWLGELGSVFTTAGNVAVSTTAQYGSDASEP